MRHFCFAAGGSLRVAAALCATLALAGLTGCSKHPLDYETAIGLLKDRNLDPVKITFSASPRMVSNDPKIREAYDSLVEGRVLVCSESAQMGTLCQPGPAGDELNSSGVNELTLVAGHWTPSVITSLAQTGRNSASAEVRMVFEATPLFSEYEGALNSIQNESSALLSLAERKDGKVLRATFQHYEDGWHVETLE